MRKSAIFLCAGVLIFGQLLSEAQSSDSIEKKASNEIPSVILSGLNAYKEKGPEEAVKAWIKGSPIDGTTAALSQSNNFRQIQDFYGAYQGFEFIKAKNYSPRTQVIYLIMDYEKGPVFAKFVVYKADRGWILTSFNVNVKEEIIFPASLL